MFAFSLSIDSGFSFSECVAEQSHDFIGELAPKQKTENRKQNNPIQLKLVYVWEIGRNLEVSTQPHRNKLNLFLTEMSTISEQP